MASGRIMRWVLLAALGIGAAASAAPVHGLWVWKSASVLETAQGQEALVQFCRTWGINEVYVSVPMPVRPAEADAQQLAEFVGRLHAAHVRVEALLSSVDADEAGEGRQKLLGHVGSILDYNRQHPAARFDGVHLDLEPQQRPENKGPGNLGFLPGLIQAYREVRTSSEDAGLTVNADIPLKLLKGDLGERRALLTSLPRFTLMLYELSSPADGSGEADKLTKLKDSGDKFLGMAYQGLEGVEVARMAIALRTSDYGPLLPTMLASLDSAYRGNPHYLGWARHSYNDTLAP